MKKKNILNLIKYYTEQNDSAFRDEAYEIARQFDLDGDYQLGEYIMSLLSSADVLVPQSSAVKRNIESDMFQKLEANDDQLLLPECIIQDIKGILNAVERKAGLNKFLFEGNPGTGKTEAAKQIARLLNRDCYAVNFTAVIDSRMGQTQKNIADLFEKMNTFPDPEQYVFLFDEIDALAMDRTDSHDIREMGRATTAMLKGLDEMSSKVLLIASSNLFSKFDKALTRRFDAIISFDRYTDNDLRDIAVKLLDSSLEKYDISKKNRKIFSKIIKIPEHLDSPGEIKNTIKTSVVFSALNNDEDYLRKLYCAFVNEKPDDIYKLKKQGFTVREIEVLADKSKSSVARKLRDISDD